MTGKLELGEVNQMIPTNRFSSHPGLILLKEFLNPNNMTQIDLAFKMNVPIQRINTIINGKRGISAETAIKLADVFQNSPQFWMMLQANFDLSKEKNKSK